MSQIIIGYTTEGTTDNRFLPSIIERTFIEVAFECSRQIEVVTPIVHIDKKLGKSFEEQLLYYSEKAHQNGVMALCTHIDADDTDDRAVWETRMEPALAAVDNLSADNCKNIVPLIPVQMTEAWMLADKQLLKEEIGTNMSDNDLNLSRRPEQIADPKAVIVEAIRIARSNTSRRRRNHLTIAELYLPIGQKMSLGLLSSLPSYQNFKEAVRTAYRKLNYLQ